MREGGSEDVRKEVREEEREGMKGVSEGGRE